MSLRWIAVHSMIKLLLTIGLVGWCCFAAGQFAIVVDSDGFAYVRDAAGTVTDTVDSGQVVYGLGTEEGWTAVDYRFDGQTSSGYIHRSRLKFIDMFDEVPASLLADTAIRFRSTSLKLTVTSAPFDPEANRLEYRSAGSGDHAFRYLATVNENTIWGTDGNVPNRQYGKMRLEWLSKVIDLPVESLFEPNLLDTRVYVDTYHETVYVTALNSDGAGGYAVLWVVRGDQLKGRVITRPF